MKQSIIFFIPFVVALAFSQSKKDNSLQSPDGKVQVTFRIISDGIPEFDILFNRKLVIGNNLMGLMREDADFSKDLKLLSVSQSEKLEDHYSLLYGKKMQCAYICNKKVFQLKNSEGEMFDIIFQVSNDGVAFRYCFPDKTNELRKITHELTTFNFDDSTHAWIQPIAAAKSGWNATNPSYEEHYFQDITIKELPTNKPGWVFPVLFKTGKYWISLTETAPDRNYCGCRLMHDSLSTGFIIGFPQAAELMAGGALKPESTLPWFTPWRIITFSNNLGTVVESTLGTDLAKPSVLNDISYVKTGRSSWTWVLFKDDSTIFSVEKRFIDYSHNMDWEYCLIDADWDRKIGYDKIAELCEYARSKGVGIEVWYNSAGDWNTTPYTPRNKLLTKELRNTEFTKLKSMGVAGIKVDFFGGDGQSVMSYYQDIIEDASRFRLMVNCHGSTFPRGWQRTYPNLISMEAIKGFEFITFDQLNAEREASHCTVIPFTRNLFDPMDFTPMCFSEVPNIQRRTTNSFELALSVLFLSGIQHFAEVPEGMAKVPDQVKQFLKEVPVAWNEKKFITGYPGKNIVIARRAKNVWYIAGINGETIEKNMKLDLSFIGRASSSLLVFCGKDNRSFEIKNEAIDLRQPLKIDLKPNDGFVLQVRL